MASALLLPVGPTPCEQIKLTDTPMQKHSALFRSYLVIASSLLLLGVVKITNAAPPSQWLPRGPGGGGALFAPSFSPHNANELYISCDMSELFHSTNLGVSWELTDFRQIQGNRESQVRFTSIPSILYALDYTSDLTTPSKS